MSRSEPVGARPVRVLGVIPARLAASRFPGKPLATLLGRPMLEHVYRRTVACSALDDVVVATCDREIADAARGFGSRVVMTSAAHVRATDRVAEAVEGSGAEIIVMVQGDEPMIEPEMIAAAVAPMVANPSISCVNLAAPIRSTEELLDPNTIKVAVAPDGRALYFSREPIPHAKSRDLSAGSWFKQVCVIPMRRQALESYRRWPQGPLETAESVDMLRFLENGIDVRIVRTATVTRAVDTPADLAAVERLMIAEGRPPGRVG